MKVVAGEAASGSVVRETLKFWFLRVPSSFRKQCFAETTQNGVISVPLQ
ncbi:hypothetical protein SCE1572_49040 [Sorangium cellulosum So0157-2]|uniref:Uncharacterized protein n=1 Tax=Sorangium cellulosum So0157-2 TaxID=1254432 RepID=S4YFU9_SORCE|nr:hypothetical protein SCE1572_49040 [Sorangium cellulosum So0157-2]